MTFIASTSNQNPIQKANMMWQLIRTKASSLKIQMLLSLDKSDTSNSEKIWKKSFFGDQKSTKPDFPQITLLYCNQGIISTLKTGDYAIYFEYVILGQITLASNCPDLDNYTLKYNEVIIYVPLKLVTSEVLKNGQDLH